MQPWIALAQWPSSFYIHPDAPCAAVDAAAGALVLLILRCSFSLALFPLKEKCQEEMTVTVVSYTWTHFENFN